MTMSTAAHFAFSSIFFGYITLILSIGFFSSYLVKNLADYMLAGRNLSGALTALGAGASDMSGWLLMALPGAAFLFGINQIWLPIGLTIGAYLNWQFEAKRLRVFTEIADNSLTIPAYLENRFHDKSRVLRLVTGLVILVFFTAYVAAGLVAGGELLQHVLGFSYLKGTVCCAIVMVIYTSSGGFWAISWIDFFQGLLMFAALLVVPVITIQHLNGFQAMLNELTSKGAHYFDAFKGISAIGVISLLAWGLGYFGQPHIITRFMAARSQHEIPVAQFICMSWMICALYGAIFTGIAGAAYFHSSGASLHNPETIFIVLAEILFNPWIAGILIAAILAAIMNTSSAQLLAAGSSLTEDFYHPFIRPQASQRELMWVIRIGIGGVTGIAVSIALGEHASILNMVAYAWAGLGAAFGPVILISLYWQRMTRNSAIAGMLTGALTVIAWELLNKIFHGVFALYSIVPGFVLNCLAIYLVSILGGKPALSVSAQFARALAQLK